MAQKEHTHRHQHKSESWRRLGLVLILTMLYMFAEVVGAWWTGVIAVVGFSELLRRRIRAEEAALGLS